MYTNVEILDGAKAIKTMTKDGHSATFNALWLRDNCPCAECRHPTGQKLTHIVDLSLATEVASAAVEDGDLRLTFAPDNHSSLFNGAWLSNFATATAATKHTTWGAETLSLADISRDYAQTIANDESLAEWLGLVARYGCAVLRDTPRKSETVCQIAELFGFVRETNYGRFFDVKAVANPNNLAYTGMGLPVHTDNPYRDPPPGLQLLHCLHNAVAGGESVLVDGFMAADVLRDENEEHWRILSRYRVPFRFIDDTTDLRSRLPVLDVAPDGDIRAVNFNNRSIAALDIPVEEMAAYYAAYRHLAEIMERPRWRLCFKMNAGDLFIVNNRRVLHGRESFTGGGERHLQGCYADNDALLAKLIMLSQ